MINDPKFAVVPNVHYAKLRPETVLPGVGNDENFGNIFESVATITRLTRNLSKVKKLIAIIIMFPEGDEEKLWRWEPSFGFQQNGRITEET
eukprot:4130370-Amphidinium_carterae.2